MTTEGEKAELGAKTFEHFCREFGDDVYSHILLEVLLEGIMHEETIFVSGEQAKEGDQTDHGPPISGRCECSTEGSGSIRTADIVEERDSPDHL